MSFDAIMMVLQGISAALTHMKSLMPPHVQTAAQAVVDAHKQFTDAVTAVPPKE